MIPGQSREVFESAQKTRHFTTRDARQFRRVRGPQNNMILSMSTLVTKSAADLVEIVVLHAKAAQSNAVSAAKGIIALVTVTGSEEAARLALKKAKVSDCTVKNAMQLVWAYDAVVAPGHASEKWFDELLYAHAVEVRRAIAKVGIAKLCEAKLFAKSAKANMLEFELIGDTGMNKEERTAALQAKADLLIVEAKAKAKKDADEAAAKKAAETPATEKVEAKAEPAKTDAPPATKADLASIETAKPGKGKKTAIEDFDSLVSTVEKFVEAVVPTADDVTVETLKNRVTSLMVKLNAAVEARAAAARKAA